MTIDPKNGRAYFTEYFRVKLSFSNYVYNELFKGMAFTTQRFGCHLIASIINNSRNDEKAGKPIPIPFYIINQQFNQALDKSSATFWMELAEAGFLELYAESVEDHKCREFDFIDRIKQDILKKWSESILDDEDVYVNLMTKKPCAKKPTLSKLTTEYRKPYPYLIKESLQVFNTNDFYLNYAAPKAVLEEIQMNWDNLNPKQQKRYTGFSTALLNLMANGTVMDDTFITYHPEYEVASSGRQFHLGVGPQGCPSDLKHLFYKDIPDIHNYDLKNSQMTILKQWFEDASISTTWIDRYLANDKQKFADVVGISLNRWKRCINALCCGGRVLHKYEDDFIVEDKKMITLYLMEEFDNDLDQVREALYKFNVVTKEFQFNLEEWKHWLITVHIKKRGVSSFPGGSHIVTNGCGMSFNLNEYKNRNGKWNNGRLYELKSRLVAHWLQGDESAFIHYLVILSTKPEYRYKAWVNEHDGLVTQGIIPPSAISEAKAYTNLKYVDLIEKPFEK